MRSPLSRSVWKPSRPRNGPPPSGQDEKSGPHGLAPLERDLSSEHKLRGREVPVEAVAEYRDLLIAQIVAEYEGSRDELKRVTLCADAVGDNLTSSRTH